jgi:hypothetical protein
MDLRLAKEEAIEILRGDGLEYLFYMGFRDAIYEMKQALLNNEELGEPTRIAYIIALRKIKEGFSTLYEKGKQSVPEWLIKEFE